MSCLGRLIWYFDDDDDNDDVMPGPEVSSIMAAVAVGWEMKTCQFLYGNDHRSAFCSISIMRTLCATDGN
jgi:hypothetical protein